GGGGGRGGGGRVGAPGRALGGGRGGGPWWAVSGWKETGPAEAAAARARVMSSAITASRARHAIAAASADSSPATSAIMSEPFATPRTCSRRKTPSRKGESCLLFATLYGASGTRAEMASRTTASRQVASLAGRPRLR